MGKHFKPTTWSPLEEDYLKTHKSLEINQLCAYMAKSRYAIQTKLAELDGETPSRGPKKRQVSKIGRRKDCDNQVMRSTWEANTYRYLKTQDNVHHIEVEPTTFSFAPFGILHGTVSYTPDFKVTFKSGEYIWIEIKGFLPKQDRTKIKRFKKYYPEEFAKLYCVVGSAKTGAAKFFSEQNVTTLFYYSELAKKCKHTIPEWES